MAATKELYEQYKLKMQRLADVRNASAVLQWDQETYLPTKGARFRGQQISTLAELAHELFTDASLGNLLQELAARQDLTYIERRNIELTLEDYAKNKKYPSAFVRALSEQINSAFHSWIEARKNNRFSIFEADLDSLIQFKKQETGILGYENHPYNALLNEYEKGCTVELLDQTFAGLLPSLQELFLKIQAQPQVNDSFLHGNFPKQQQWDWGMKLIKGLRFDFESGRQDISEHPFSTSFNKNDVRITTRIDEKDFGNMTWSCIHEVGHALYEQGLPEEGYGLPLGEACSLSIHESQSRLWENNVGRAKPFWEFYFPVLQQHFPEVFGTLDLEAFYKGINKVQPSFIRTEADEITYPCSCLYTLRIRKRLN